MPTDAVARPRRPAARARPRPRPRATRRQNAARALARQRVHEAHRRAALDAVDQHVGEPVDARASVDRVQASPGRRRRVIVACAEVSDAITTLARGLRAGCGTSSGGRAAWPGSRLRAAGARRRPTVTSIAPSSTHTCWCTRGLARAGLEGDARRRAGTAPRRSASAAARPAARRCAGRSPRPGRATRGWSSRRATGPRGGRAAASNSEASVTPSPAASFSSTTAVGLLSPRSMSEIIERLTPLCVGQRVEREPAPGAQVAHARGDPDVEIAVRDSGHAIQHTGCQLAQGGCSSPRGGDVVRRRGCPGDRRHRGHRRRRRDRRGRCQAPGLPDIVGVGVGSGASSGVSSGRSTVRSRFTEVSPNPPTVIASIATGRPARSPVVATWIERRRQRQRLAVGQPLEPARR